MQQYRRALISVTNDTAEVAGEAFIEILEHPLMHEARSPHLQPRASRPPRRMHARGATPCCTPTQCPHRFAAPQTPAPWLHDAGMADAAAAAGGERGGAAG